MERGGLKGLAGSRRRPKGRQQGTFLPAKRGRTITQRWLLNSLGVIFGILLLVVVGFSFAIRNYYYSSARQYVAAKMNTVSGLLQRYSQDSSTSFSREVQGLVENFSDRERMELMALDRRGQAAITSSGFIPAPSTPMEDYQTARFAQNGQGVYVGKLPEGEKILSMTVMISDPKSEYSAVRLVTSLKTVDEMISLWILLLSLGCLLVLALMLFSGMYFVKSIVFPVRELGAAARRFATGDFSVRMEKKNDDEIGELCDIINYMADELSHTESMKNDFISSVSHELRTPLTAIKGWAETIEEMTDDPDTVQKGMRVINNETQRLSQMVEELLDFSRMQSGRFSLEKERMDILAELGEAVLIYMERARREKITILYDEPDMLPFVNGDKNRLRQVFINIIDNAIKYAEPGGTVTVEAGINETGDTVNIIVSDDGCGISAEDLPKIKTKFYKANHTRRGSGIGLAVANEIVAMHGGTLDVFSQLNVGTKVAISLPAASRMPVPPVLEE